MEHRPVLLAEVLGFLAGTDLRLVLDATVGLGGLARAVLEAYPEVRVVGLDWDTDMLKAARERLGDLQARVAVEGYIAGLHHSPLKNTLPISASLSVIWAPAPHTSHTLAPSRALRLSHLCVDANQYD